MKVVDFFASDNKDHWLSEIKKSDWRAGKKELMGIFQRICMDNGILSTPDECFRFMQELPDKYPQMRIFDL